MNNLFSKLFYKVYRSFIRKPNYLIGILILSLLSPVFGQFPNAGGNGNNSPNPVNIPSPNAATLGIFGQIPVSLYNGLPNISIPLFSAEGIDLRLSYHASGIRPDEHSGWVGVGWNLNTGGAITRIVNGGVDEYLGENDIETSDYSYYDHPDVLDNHNWCGITSMVTYRSYFSLINQHPEDNIPKPQPDEFAFNFNGISGSFFYNHKGRWIVKTDAPVDLRINEELVEDFILTEEIPFASHNQDFPYTLNRIFYGFTLTNSDGTKYIFGLTPESIEFTANIPELNVPGNNNYVATTWYLTKIISPEGREIIFNYEKNNRAVYRQSITSTINWWNHALQQQYYQNAKNYNLNKTFPTYLSSIESELYTIDFSKSLSDELKYSINSETFDPWIDDLQHFDYDSYLHWYKLNEISIEDYKGNPIKYIEFEYNSDPNARLFLDEVRELNKYKQDPLIYSFTYNTQELPSYNSQELDHWGYYNGNNYFNDNPPDNFPLYTKEQILSGEYYDSRYPDANLMKAGILEEIVYPTGGYTKFYYEPHDYSQVIQKKLEYERYNPYPIQQDNAGGLRISKIISSPNGTEQPLIKEYFYVNDYQNNDLSSSGVLAGIPEYIEQGSDFDDVVEYCFLNSYSVEPLSFTNGNHVTYSKVVEKEQNNGFTEYTYSNHETQESCDKRQYISLTNNTEQWKYVPFNSKALERGRLLEEKYFSDDELIKEIKYNYSSLPVSEDNSIRSVYISVRKFGEPITDGPFTDLSGVAYESVLSAYHIYNYFIFQEEVITTEYAENGNPTIESSVEYKYNNRRLLTEKNILNSDNTSIHQYKKYPSDYMWGDDDTYHGETWIFKKMVDRHMIDYPVEITLKKNDGSTSVVTKSELFLYKEYENSINLREKLELEIDDPITEPIFGLTYTTATLNFPAPNSTIHFNKDNRYKPKDFYEYSNEGNLLEYNMSDNISTSYIWGYNGYYPISSAENAKNKDIFHTDFEEPIAIIGWAGSTVLIEEQKHTGENSLKSVNTSTATSEIWHRLPPLNINNPTTRKYKISCWVYSTGPSADLFALYYDDEESYINAEYIRTYETNKWVYLEKEISVPANTRMLVPRLDNNKCTSCGSQGIVYYDQVRVYPADAKMTTYTYDPLIGMTSQTDPNGRTTFYEYDPFGRLWRILNQNRNILKQYDYHYINE